MSAAEFVTPSVVYSALFPALGTGGTAGRCTVAPAAQPSLNSFKLGVSRICGLQVVTNTGSDPASLNVSAAVPGGATFPSLTLSGAAGDTSVYRVFWRNEATASLIAC